MSDVQVSLRELEALRERADKSAKSNAWLRLLNGMLTELSAAKGLEQVVGTILSVLMQTIGAANLIVYYTLEGRWHSRDASGAAREMPAPDDPLVARAIETGADVQSEPSRDVFSVGEVRHVTWVFPLVVQQRVVGAVSMEGMQLIEPGIRRELQPFFVYSALMLGNEISNYSALERAHRDLLEAHETLALETAARREVEEYYRTLFDQSPDGVVVVDPRTRSFVRYNTAAHEHLGYTREEFGALHLLDVVTEMSAGDIERRTERLLAGQTLTFDALHRTKSGELRNVVVTGKALQLGRDSVILTIFRDVTAAKKLEEDLLRAQKLESVGVLAGGIAHDFNNFLMAILGNVALAGQMLPPGSPAAGLLRECETACAHARALTQHLLTFAKGGAPVKSLARLDQLVRESALFASRGSGARCDFDIPDDLWSADVDTGQISQVIHNLVINAVQAMPTGGAIRISCRNLPASADGSSTPALVKIEIEDHGVGIPADHLSKIFDPYFTTKQKGSGLGLASVYSIVGRHDGRVEVESTPGEGTTFRVYLPASPGLAPARVTAESVPTTRFRRILVMDDDKAVGRVVTRMLSQLGAEVRMTVDGAEAVAAYRDAMAAARPFDLVILDLTVPGGMGGRETIVHLRALDPRVRALVSSGYSGDATIADCAEVGFAGVLQKPYVVDDLLRVLAELP